MPATRSRRSRKRKQPDSFNDELPNAKKRKLGTRYKKPRISTNKPNKDNNKSQSEEPKLSNPPDPFKHTTVPSVSFNNRHHTKPSTAHSTTRRYSQYPYTKDESQDINKDTTSEDEDDDLSTSPDSESTHNQPLRPRNAAIRSQPSTPIRGITVDKRSDLSQSAKKSRGYKAHTRNTNTIRSPIPHNISSSLCTKPHKPSYSVTNREAFTSPPRRRIPGLHPSQDSISFSPSYTPSSPFKHQAITTRGNALSPHHTRSSPYKGGEGERHHDTHVIPVAATPRRCNVSLPQQQQHTNTHREVSQSNVVPWSSLFSLIGFIVGFFVCISVYCENELNVRDARPATKAFVMDTNDAMCTCDVESNTASRLCRPCMDQYYQMETQWTQCKQEREKMESAQVMRARDCEKDKNELKRLKQEVKALQSVNGEDAMCNGYKRQVGALKHELGECHVEWGSCEQLGRQKDKLDEKRVEEIVKQKNKFGLCNEQLKRYKAETKKRNRK
eukprot:212401_1